MNLDYLVLIVKEGLGHLVDHIIRQAPRDTERRQRAGGGNIYIDPGVGPLGDNDRIGKVGVLCDDLLDIIFVDGEDSDVMLAVDD